MNNIHILVKSTAFQVSVIIKNINLSHRVMCTCLCEVIFFLMNKRQSEYISINEYLRSVVILESTHYQ